MPPLPQPNSGETREDFIERNSADVTAEAHRSIEQAKHDEMAKVAWWRSVLDRAWTESQTNGGQPVYVIESDVFVTSFEQVYGPESRL